MALGPDLLRGNTDTIILRFLNEKDSYGYEINRNIREMTGGEYELSEATLYTAFRRLEKDGYIESYWGDENSGARRRYYRITDKGKQKYTDNLKEWESSYQMIERLIRK